MESGNFRLPAQLNIREGNPAENFRKWKRHYDVYSTANGFEGKSKKQQTAMLLHCAGPDVVDLVDQLKFTAESDKEDPKIVLQKLEEYCQEHTSEVLESFKFWNLPQEDTFDTFLTALMKRAQFCNFGDMAERMVRDKIVFTVKGQAQELLLRERNLTLKKTIEIMRSLETSTTQMHEMNLTKATDSANNHPMEANINKVRAFGQTRSPVARRSGNGEMMTMRYDFNYCGQSHLNKRNSCPAWGKICAFCKGRNHFESKCHKKTRVRAVEVENDPITADPNDRWLAAVNQGTTGRATILMQINGKEVRFHIDTAADVNTIRQEFVMKEQVKPTRIRLRMWNESKMIPIGETILQMSNPRDGTVTNVEFVVVQNSYANLLGLKTISDLGLITLNQEKYIAKIGKTTDLGNFGISSLTLDPTVKPRALPCRKIPFAIEEKVQKGLNDLVDRGILAKVNKPTPWVSQMAVVKKPSGALRICLDPQPLNADYYRLPVLQDILPKLHKARIFSKFDVQEAYWHVQLDDEASYLTTMITPFGRYRWLRLPFGLKVSSEIFQRRLTEALGDLPQTFCIADDIIVVGQGQNDSDAKKDLVLHADLLKKRCHNRNIKLNERKAVTEQKEVTFMGHVITADCIRPDLNKVLAIRDMPTPQNIHDARRLCGMIQYLARFLPDLADMLEPIRALTRKNTQWDWNTDCQDSLRRIKNAISEAPVLQYFDPEKTLTLQVDSSLHGVGAVILQDGKPIEYASRALSNAERNWAQIEKEALAVVFGLERFDQYTYGREVIVKNDHKPLMNIFKKPLSQAPKRLQNLIIRLHRYCFEFKYTSGAQLHIADALSRAHLITETHPTKIMSVDALYFIPDKQIQEVEEETSKDATLQQLKQVITEGWPSQKQDIPSCIQPYYDLRDTLSVQNGVIVKGERILIP